VNFLLCYGAMLHASRDDDELARIEKLRPIPKLHFQTTVEDQEKFVLVSVAMPDEGALQLGELDLLTIEGADDVRLPMLVNLGKFFLKIDDG